MFLICFSLQRNLLLLSFFIADPLSLYQCEWSKRKSRCPRLKRSANPCDFLSYVPKAVLLFLEEPVRQKEASGTKKNMIEIPGVRLGKSDVLFAYCVE